MIVDSAGPIEPMQRVVPSPMRLPHPRAARRRGLLLCAPFVTLLLASPIPLRAAQHYSAHLDPYERAERLREALEGRPEQQRTRLQYDRVLEAYRAIYHGNPAAPKADASIAAVADLLAEEGRIFQDEKALHDAIGQYEFLRHQYPATRFRFSALLTEGEIYQRDLGDLDQAKAVYQSFLHQYPQSPLADEARNELKTIRRAQWARDRGRSSSQETAHSRSHHDTVLSAAIHSREESARHHYDEPARTPAPQTRTRAAIEPSRPAAPTSSPARQSEYASPRSQRGMEESDIPPLVPSTAAPSTRLAPSNSARSDSARSDSEEAPATTPASEDLNAPPPPSRSSVALITGIRHWSTTVYTRVAIDLQQEVRYQAARVPHPDRIFFDLYNTRLSPELIGHSVEVTDDGFLSRIRVAQFSSNMTRIVLDVNSVSDYSAFFLPNPPRLIIDVHGRRGGPPPMQVASTELPEAQPERPSFAPAPQSRPAPPTSARTAIFTGANPSAARPESAAPAAAPSNSSSSSSSALGEVRTLSSQPNQVRATKHPTTAPIVASVSGTTPAPQPAPRTVARLSRPAMQPRVSDDVPPAESGATGVPAADTYSGSQHLPTSMVRALGLKINRIVIDAGHGGHDSGTLGPGGLEEKDVVLDVALRLGRLLKQRLGADVIYTRSDDTFIPLETRTAIANQAQADLFISIHANSSRDPDARGVETYYLNFTSSADALEVAARENSVSDQSIHQLSDLVKKIALQDKINESREFASDVQESLYSGLEQGNSGLKDRGVKKAPFVVLIGANMPSILAEISFLTNPDDAHELREPAYRERIAESLYRGVSRYVSSLNGIHVAQAGTHPSATE